jgi:RimJ/RimL family protein N-acetyltransferase
LTVDPRVPSFEIGSTWVVPTFQRTRTNTEAKYLQLSLVFEELSAARVELKTDVRNERSRSAIARIGAREEGILRNHMRRADGTLRDSMLFSITLEEWPKVKQALAEKLAVT